MISRIVKVNYGEVSSEKYCQSKLGKQLTLLAADRADRPEGTRRQKPGLVWVKAASGANPPGVLKLSLCGRS